MPEQPDNAKPPSPATPEKPDCAGIKTSCLWPLLFMFLVAGISVGLLYLEYWNSASLPITINCAYFAFALLGVVFHMASKYREARDQDGFDLRTYWIDYVFRAFQACLYVLIIDNLTLKDITQIDMTIIAIFTGMFIRQVEEAFESVGDRFGNMLSGILGARLQKLSVEERQKAGDALQQKEEALLADYMQHRTELTEEARKEFDSRFTRLKNLYSKEGLDGVNAELTRLTFRLNDYLKR